VSQKQTLFSEFYKTMTRMRKLLNKTTDVPADKQVSTMLQSQALEYIDENPELSAGELAAGLQMSSSAVSQLTDRLIAAKFVSRKHGKADRRAIHFELTSIGKKHLHKLLARRKVEASKILGPMSENDLREVIRIFNNVLEKNQ
jgi:MarR family transcriptional regulator, organic hydroperoxide resistance regulator